MLETTIDVDPRSYGAKAHEGDQALDDQLQEFFGRYPVDERGQQYLTSSPQEVIERCIREFKPPREGESDYSSLLTSYVKRLRTESRGGTRVGGAQPATQADSPASQVLTQADSFWDRYPVDQNAYDFVLSSSPEVQLRVVNEFKPPREGESDYSALMMSFVKKIRSQQVPVFAERGFRPREIARPSGHRIEDFVRRYPVDDRALEYFHESSPEVQFKVLDEFRAKKEGEADYSTLFMAFIKRCRGLAYQAAPRAPVLPVRHSVPYAPSRPVHTYNGGPSYGSAGYAAVPASRPVSHGGYTNGAAPSRQPAGGVRTVLSAGIEGLEAFRRRFFIDQRCFEYLAASSEEVRLRVINTFVPQRPNDTDYSAPVTAYIRDCRKALGEASASAVGSSEALGAPVLGGSLYGSSGGRRGYGGNHSGGGGHSGYAHRDTQESYSGQGQSNDAAAGLSGSIQNELSEFLRRYPVDTRAVDFLTSCSEAVVEQVIREFRAKREGEEDYSALVMAFCKRCRDQGGSYPEPAHKRQRFDR